MNRKVLISIIVIVAIVAIVGVIVLVNNRNSNIQIDIEELSTQIIERGSFSDELAKVDSQMVMNDYSFTSDEIKAIVSYQGSGATSEELVILEVNDKSFLSSVKNKVNTRLDERKEAFESYLPAEVFKIDNSLLEVKGNYLILCISNDYDKAETIIKENINS